MFGFLGSVTITDKKVEEDFSVHEIDTPSRCIKCSRMHPIGTKFGWVNSVCHFGGSVRSYEELKTITDQSCSFSGWCLPCIKSPSRS